MEQLRKTLIRCGVAELSNIVGTYTTALLDAMEIKALSAQMLTDIALDLRAPEFFITNAAARRRLIEALSESDACRLASLLNIPSVTDPWAEILKLSFTPKHINSDVLRRFFGLPPCQPVLKEARPGSFFIEPSYTLFEHQIAVQKAAEKVLSSSKPRVMLHMPTGSGKTRTAMNIIANFLRNECKDGDVVLWLAYSEELCSQAASEFQKAWYSIGNRPTKLCLNFRDRRTSYDDATGFMVGSLALLSAQSLSEQKAFLKFARRVRLVILDEAHQATAPTYNHLLHLLAPTTSTAILGLTATPGRSWLDAGQDVALAQFFYGQKVGLKFDDYESPVDYLQDQGFLAKVEYQQIRYEIADQIRLTPRQVQAIAQSLDLPQDIIDQLSQNARRNALILHQIMNQASDSKNKIIVFACSVQHAQLLANVLRVRGFTARAIIGDMDKSLREQSIRDFRDSDRLQILTTYDVLTTGFDAPRANVAFVTRPTSSVVLYTQMVGRVARGPKQGGNETCRVFTVLDDIPGFRSLGEGFEFWEDIWSDSSIQGVKHD